MSAVGQLHRRLERLEAAARSTEAGELAGMSTTQLEAMLKYQAGDPWPACLPTAGSVKLGGRGLGELSTLEILSLMRDLDVAGE